jgi:hypothetical protein
MWKFEKIFIHTCDMFLQIKSHIIGHMIYYNNPQLLKVHGCFFMDFITNLMCSKPYNSIFVVVDWFTKMAPFISTIKIMTNEGNSIFLQQDKHMP